MATDITKLIDLQRLSEYDVLIKGVITDESAKAIKTVLWDSTNEQINFYKKYNATSADTPDYSVSISSSDVQNLQSRVGMASTLNSYQSASNLTDIMNILTGNSSTAGSVAKALADAESYTDTAIAALDADLDASGTAQHSGTFVVSGVTEVDGVITAVDSVEVEAAGAAAALAAILASVATSGAAEDVSYDNTDSALTATNVQDAIDEIDGVLDTLGTAAVADVATTPIVESSSDDSLVSAAQVAAFVSSEIEGLEGAMHFRGVITRQTGETDAQAIARVITDPEAGDVVVMSDNAKEYVYDGTAWKEVGDETEFVKKTTTIAGVDLADNITKSELQTALDLGSAAYTASTDYDAAGTAASLIANLDATESQTAGADGLALSITETDGVITAISGSIAANTYDAYGSAASAASAAVAALDSSTDDITATADTSLNLLTSVSITDGLISSTKATTIGFATQQEIADLFD